MGLSNKPIPTDVLSFSVANISLSDNNLVIANQNSQSQETGFKNSMPANENLENSNQNSQFQETGFIPSSIPLNPQRIGDSILSEKDPIFTGLNKEIPPHPISSIIQEANLDSRGFERPADRAFFTLAVSPEGSRTLQQILMAGNPSDTSQVLQIVTSRVSGTPLLYFLMIDPYGCHVCSKLINSCNSMQLGFLVENIIRDDAILFIVSTNSEGSKLMKKVIKFVKGTPYSYLIVLRLSALFYRLMTNKTGSYVVNFCLDWLDLAEITPLYEQAISQGLDLATHAIGCASLNSVIDKIQGFHRQQLLGLVSQNAVFLSQDPSGNHVLQKVLALENPIFNGVIGSMLRGHYVRLSMQKWGSHVVEKCLNSQAAMEYGAEDFANCGSNQLVQIAKDRFGNFVIQSALKVTKQRNKSLYLKLVESLRPQLSVLKFGYGRNIYHMVVSEIYHNSIL